VNPLALLAGIITAAVAWAIWLAWHAGDEIAKALRDAWA
jgi:hypothetical protein